MADRSNLGIFMQEAAQYENYRIKNKNDFDLQIEYRFFTRNSRSKQQKHFVKRLRNLKAKLLFFYAFIHY